MAGVNDQRGNNSRVLRTLAISKEQLTAFLAKVAEDSELMAKLSAADPAVVVVMAKEMGFEISVDELARLQAELSEDVLDGIAGGCGYRFRDVSDEPPGAALCGCGEENCDCLSCEPQRSPA